MLLYAILCCFLLGARRAASGDSETVSWLPPWLMAAIIDQDHTGKIRVHDGCDMVYYSDNCTIHLKPKGSSCKQLLNFRNVFKDQLKLEVFYNLTDSTLPSDNFYIYNVDVDLCNNDITFVTKNTVTVNFIDRYILLSDVKMQTVLKGFEKFDESKISIHATGKVVMNNKHYKITITKALFNNFYEIQINAHKVLFKDLLFTFRVEKSFFKGLCRFSRKAMLDFVAENFLISGIYDFKRGFYFSGNVILTAPYFKQHLLAEIIIIREPLQPIKVGVMIKGNIHKSILPLLEHLLKRKKSNLPLIDDVGHGLLSISSHYISRSHFDRNIRPRSIPKGVVLQTVSKLQDIHKSQSEVFNNNTSGLRLAKLRFCNKKDKIELSPNTDIDLAKFLRRLSNSEYNFPSWLKSSGRAIGKVEKIEYSGSNKENVLVKLNFKTSLKILFGALKVDQINLELTLDRSHKPNQWICGFSSLKKSVGSIDVKVSVTCDEGLQNFKLNIEIVCLSFSKLLKLLRIDDIPYELKKKMNTLYNFEIKGLRIEATQNQEEFMRVTGVPLLFGLENLAMEGMVWVEEAKKKFAFGIILKDIEFLDMLKKLTGKKLNAFWVGKTSAAILLSNTNSKAKKDNYSGKVRVDQTVVRSKRDTPGGYTNTFGGNNMVSNSQFVEPNYRQYLSDMLQHNEAVSSGSQSSFINSYTEPLQQQIPQQVSYFDSRPESPSALLIPSNTESKKENLNFLNTFPNQPVNTLNSLSDRSVNAPLQQLVPSLLAYSPTNTQVNDIKKSFSELNILQPPFLLKESALENNGLPVLMNNFQDPSSFRHNIELNPTSSPVRVPLVNPILYSPNNFFPSNFVYQPHASSLVLEKNIAAAPTVSIMNKLMEAYRKVNLEKMKENQNQAKNIEAGIIDMMADKRSFPLSSIENNHDSLIHNNLYEMFMKNADAMMRSLGFSSKSLVTHDDKRKSNIAKPEKPGSIKTKHSEPQKVSQKNKNVLLKKQKKLSEKKKNLIIQKKVKNKKNKKRSEIKHREIKQKLSVSSPDQKKNFQEVDNIKNIPVIAFDNSSVRVKSVPYHNWSHPSSSYKFSKTVVKKNTKLIKKKKDQRAVTRNWVEIHIPETSEDSFTPYTNEDDVANFINTTTIVLNDSIDSFVEPKFNLTNGSFFNERLGLSRPNITGLNEYGNISQFTSKSVENRSFQNVTESFSKIAKQHFPANTFLNNDSIKNSTAEKISIPVAEKHEIEKNQVKIIDGDEQIINQNLNITKQSFQQLESIEQKSLHDVIWFGLKHSTDPEVFFKYNPQENTSQNNSIVNNGKVSEEINPSNTKIKPKSYKSQQQFTYVVPENSKLLENSSIINVDDALGVNVALNLKVNKFKTNSSNPEVLGEKKKGKNVLAVKDDDEDTIEVITNPGVVVSNHKLGKSNNLDVFKLSLTDGDIDDLKSITQNILQSNNSSAYIHENSSTVVKIESNVTSLNRSLNTEKTNDLKTQKNSSMLLDKIQAADKINSFKSNSNNDSLKNMKTNSKPNHLSNSSSAVDFLTDLLENNGNFTNKKQAPNGTAPEPEKYSGKPKASGLISKDSKHIEQAQNATKDMPKEKKLKKPITMKSRSDFVNLNDSFQNSFYSKNFYELLDNKTENNISIPEKVLNVNATNISSPINITETKKIQFTNKSNAEEENLTNVKSDEEEDDDDEGIILSSDEVDHSKLDLKETPNYNHTLDNSEVDKITELYYGIQNASKSKLNSSIQKDSLRNDSGDPIEELEKDFDEIDLVKKSGSSKSLQALHDDSDDPLEDTNEDNNSVYAKKLHDYLYNDRYKEYEEKSSEDHGQVNEYLHGLSDADSLDNIAQIVSMYKSKLKHESAPKFVEIKKFAEKKNKNNKKMYLVKNKKLQVVMEIRPDSKSNKISVETQGIENLYHPFIQSENRKKILSNLSEGVESIDDFEMKRYPTVNFHSNPSKNEQNSVSNNSKKKMLLDVISKLKKYHNFKEQISKSKLNSVRLDRKMFNKPKTTQKYQHVSQKIINNPKLQSELNFLKKFSLFAKELNKGKFNKHWKDDADIDGGIENLDTSQLNSRQGKDIENILVQDTQKKNRLNQTYVDVTADPDPLEIFQGNKYEGSHMLSDTQKKNVQARLVNSSSTYYPAVDESVRNEVSSALTAGEAKLNSHKIPGNAKKDPIFHEIITSDSYKKFADIPSAYDTSSKSMHILSDKHPVIYNDSMVEFFKRNLIPEDSSDILKLHNHSFDSDDAFNMFQLAEQGQDQGKLKNMSGLSTNTFKPKVKSIKVKKQKKKKLNRRGKSVHKNHQNHHKSEKVIKGKYFNISSPGGDHLRVSNKTNQSINYPQVVNTTNKQVSQNKFANSSIHLKLPIKEAIKKYLLLTQQAQHEVLTYLKNSSENKVWEQISSTKHDKTENEVVNKSRHQFLEDFATENLKGIDEKIGQLKRNLEKAAIEDNERRFSLKDIERLKGITDKINEFKMSLKDDLEKSSHDKNTVKNLSYKKTLSEVKKSSNNNINLTKSSEDNDLSFFLNIINHSSLKEQHGKQKLSNKEKSQIVFKTERSTKLQTNLKKNFIQNDNKDFLMQELKNIAIVDGVSLGVAVIQSASCHDDKMCMFIKRNAANSASLYLSGKFLSGGIELSVTVPGIIQLTKTLSMESLELVMQIKKTNSQVFIKAELKFLDQDLRFNGKLDLGANDLQLSMSMKNQWTKPFGIDLIAINNPRFSAGYKADSPSFFEIIGDFVLGSNDELKGELHIGYDLNDPSRNYFFGEVLALTVKQLMNAFNKTVVLPQVIESSHFPHGLLVSYTSNPNGHKLIERKIKIEYGFMLSGLINFIGYEVFCIIKFTTAEIIINIYMPPMEFGGGFVLMQSSEENSNHGPSMVLHISKSEVLLQAEGEASMLGIHGPALLLISNDTFNLKMKSNLYDLVEGTLLLAAGADEGLSSAKFKLDSCLTIKTEKLKEAIINKMKSKIEVGKDAIHRARSKLDETIEFFNQTKEMLNAKMREINEKENELFSDSQKIVQNQKFIKQNCFRKCPKVCQKGFSVKKRCKKVLHRWVTCRSIERCYRQRPQLSCILKCEQQKFFKRSFNFVTKERALDKFLDLKSQKANLHLYESVIEKVPLKIAKELFSSVSEAVRVGDKVLNLLDGTSNVDIFQFKHFCLWGNLAELSDHCVGYNMSITVFKQDVSLAGNLCINEKIFQRLSEEVVIKKYPEIVEMEKFLLTKEKDFEKFEHEKYKLDALLKKVNLIRQRSTEDFKAHYDISNSSVFTSPVQKFFDGVIHASEPGYLFHPDIIFSIYGHREVLPSSILTKTGHKSSMRKRCGDYCSCLTRTIHIYKEIADGLDSVLSSVKQENDHHTETKNKLEKTLYSKTIWFDKSSTYDAQRYLDLKYSLNRSYHKWLNVTIKQLTEQERAAIPGYISEIRDVFPENDLESFLGKLHQQARRSVKRSAISRRTKSMEIDNIDEIKLGLEKLLFYNEPISLDEKIARIRVIKQKLSLALTFGKLCKVSKLAAPITHVSKNYNRDFEDSEGRPF